MPVVFVAASKLPTPFATFTMHGFLEEASGKEYHLTLVYPHEAGAEGSVSVLAPVGCALLGLSVGQTIDWAVPGGKSLKLTLLGVDYQPEAAGEVR